MSRGLERRDVIKIIGSVLLGAAGFYLARRSGIGFLFETEAPQSQQRHEEDRIDQTKPDEIYFQICEAFGLNYKDPEVAPYMQPPQVKDGTAICGDGAAGCISPFSQDNIIYVSDLRRSIVAHEMGHKIFKRYREYLSLEDLRHRFGSEEEFQEYLSKQTSYAQSYPGYPDARITPLVGENIPSPAFHEFVAFCAESSIGMREPEKPESADDHHKEGATAFWYAKLLYGDKALPRIAGKVVMGPGRVDIEGVNPLVEKIDRYAKELGY